MRHPIAELRTTLFAALAVSCGTAAKDDAPPQVVIEPEPPRPVPTTVTSTKPTPTPPPAKLVGYETVDGAVNRLGPATCSTEIPQLQCKGTETHQRCKADADCTDHPHGRCVSAVGQIGTYCGCQYSCANDRECDTGEVCICGDAITTHHGGSVCAPAACTKAADCADGACGVSSYDNGCGRRYELACRGEDDACKSDADCGSGGQCAFEKDGFACLARNCAIGRPLMVAGELRSAEPTGRSDWHQALDEHWALTDEQRRIARQHYLAIAALEHGSVGSFARFTLQLLALGAPAHLLAETQRAALDEVRHAQLMYGVASSLGADVGPGPVHAAETPPTRPEDVLAALVEEGCVGETLGAAEAAAAATTALPALAATLRDVAEDETRHAVLAWDTLTWMLTTWPELRPAAEAAFEKSLARLPEASNRVSLPALGMLPAAEVDGLRSRTVSEVIRPLVAHAVTT